MAGVSYGNLEIRIEKVGNNGFNSKKRKFSSHQQARYATVEMIRNDNIQVQEHVRRLYIQRRALC
jgi:hypothetical protein